ncbi:hypothetical protein [Burkholderia pseudomallei]|jgi:hypothetical protein|uniref:hypothetical protein n=1 Tax=Burkholderia pseudomallei TaxID=28450 RepID=UPI0024E01391|nr:hypothetical protein [Burkholderia pseudomallei]
MSNRDPLFATFEAGAYALRYAQGSVKHYMRTGEHSKAIVLMPILDFYVHALKDDVEFMAVYNEAKEKYPKWRDDE